jgi:hypothetical protein
MRKKKKKKKKKKHDINLGRGVSEYVCISKA